MLSQYFFIVETKYLIDSKYFRIHQLQKLNYDLLEKIEMLGVQERYDINMFENKNKDIEDMINLESKNWDSENIDFSDYEIMEDLGKHNIMVDSNR